MAVALLAGSMASCADLDTEYLGGYVSVEQKEQTGEMNPEIIAASVVGVFSDMIAINQVYTQHFDFGYPAIMLGYDLQTADMNVANTGYNWMPYWSRFSSPTNIGTPTQMCWYHMYQQIKIENDVLSSLDAESTDDNTMFFRAQALGARSFNYWVLAQSYAFNYQNHQNDLCVPILTDVNAQEAALEGAPRATVAEVYEQIMSDINTAIDLLSTTKTTAASVVSSAPKRMISLATAYGLRARYNLTMGKYAEAANDAQAAINSFSGRPYTIEEVQRPAFASLNDAPMMWGAAITTQDDCVLTGIVNWPSFVCTFTGNGYVTVGAWKGCAQDLYRSIPVTDVRKGWWLDENWTSPNLNAAEQAYINDFVGEWTLASTEAVWLYPYTNVKFSSYQGVLEQTDNANDIPYMRVEEMYYILAEAQGMSGNIAGGVSTLENFVRTYRNPQYKCTASSAEALQEEVFQQRRIELWGEGLVYFDYMRLNKGVDRRKALAPDLFCINVEPNNPCLIYLIPEDEMNNNKAINGKQNNNVEGKMPTPVPNEGEVF